MTNAFQRSDAFTSNGLETASSSKILVMCFDRLDRDLKVAREAIGRQDHYVTNESLTHAQDLLGEVAAMLDVEAWTHAPSLLAVYDYVLRLLAKANLLKAEPLVAEAQQLLGEVGDAFRSAAENVASTVAPMAVDDGSSSGLSIRA